MIKKCEYCGGNIINRSAEKFCSHVCRAAYMRLEADKKRFRPIANFEEYVKQWHKPMRIVISRLWELSRNAYDVEDFKQVCLIKLWRLICNDPEKLKSVSYVMKTFELAIKEFCREQGKNNHDYLSEDPIFFANPERIAEQREYIRKIKGDGFRLLLMYSMGDMSMPKLAKKLGMTEGSLDYRIWSSRNVLRNILEYE